MASFVTSEVIVHAIRKLPFAPNAGGYINKLRAARLKFNLLLAAKIDGF